jgi:NhaP-type Na+/H+ or K+/H+ antiporter
MMAGWGLALLLFSDLSVWEAGLIAVILAPTDAALGQAVISNPRVPQRIRQALNIESGLNDGLALPVFFVVLEAAQASEASLGAGSLVREIVSQVFIAAAVGVALGWLAARLILWTAERDWMAPAWSKVAMLAVALGAWVFGDGLGGSGFLAAWIAGLVIGRELRETQPGIGEFTEDTSHVLTLLSFFVFGAFVLGDVTDGITWQVALYAVLSLTAIRILPVAVAMSGSGLRSQSVLYLGWFGPRGLASIILVATIVEESELAGSETITLVMAATVGLSIYAHGASAWWGSNRYADWYESQGDHAAELPESDEVAHVPVSRRFGHID